VAYLIQWLSYVSTIRSKNPNIWQEIVFSKTSRSSGPIQRHVQLVLGFIFPWLTHPVRAVDRCPPSSAEVMNEWSYTSSPYICRYAWTGTIVLFVRSYWLAERLLASQ
jgi:hypothetical protein